MGQLDPSQHCLFALSGREGRDEMREGEWRRRQKGERKQGNKSVWEGGGGRDSSLHWKPYY